MAVLTAIYTGAILGVPQTKWALLWVFLIAVLAWLTVWLGTIFVELLVIIPERTRVAGDPERIAEAKDRPNFVAAITKVFVDGDHQQPEFMNLYVYLDIRNKGVESATHGWTLKVVSGPPMRRSAYTAESLAGNLPNDTNVIPRGGRRMGYLLYHGRISELGFTTGQRPAVKASFKDVHDRVYSVIDPPHFEDEFFKD